MSKIVSGLSDALAFAKGADVGARITIYSASEFYIGGVRFNHGKYELKRLGDYEGDGADFTVKDF